MKKIFEYYSPLIPITVLLLYTLGYVNLKVYYLQLGIDIEYYLTLSDLLFYALNTLIVIFIAYFLIEVFMTVLAVIFLFLFLKFTLRKYFKRKNKPSKINKRFFYIKMSDKVNFMFAFMISSLVFCGIVIFYFDEFIFGFTLLFALFYFQMSHMYSEKSKSETNLKNGKLRDRDYGVVAIFILLLVLNVYQGISKADEITGDEFYFRKPKYIQFEHESKVYHIGDRLRYIGESTGYIFVYDKARRESLIFDRSSISNLKVIDPRMIVSKKVKYHFDLLELFTTFDGMK